MRDDDCPHKVANTSCHSCPRKCVLGLIIKYVDLTRLQIRVCVCVCVRVRVEAYVLTNTGKR